MVMLHCMCLDNHFMACFFRARSNMQEYCERMKPSKVKNNVILYQFFKNNQSKQDILPYITCLPSACDCFNMIVIFLNG